MSRRKRRSKPVTIPVAVGDAQNALAAPSGGWGAGSNASVLFNALTQIGTSQDDASWNRFHKPRHMSDTELCALGRDELVAHALSAWAKHGLRAGWRLAIHDERFEAYEVAELEARVKRQLEALQTDAMIIRADVLARQYGLSLLVMGADDGLEDWTEPLAPNAQLMWLSPYDRRCMHISRIAPYTSPRFRLPEVYSIQQFHSPLTIGEAKILTDSDPLLGVEVPVHWSRALRFATRDGLPMLEGMQHVIGGMLGALTSTGKAMREVSVGVYKINGFRSILWGQDAPEIRANIALQDRAKSALNALVLGEGEDYTVPGRQLTGLDSLLDRWMVLVAAYFRQPVTLLWGVSPGGFGTGESETRTFDDEVRAWQTDVLKPELLRLVAASLTDPTGGGLPTLPEQWTIEFNPLRSPTAREIAETRKIAAEYFGMLHALGVPAAVIAESALAGEFSLDIKLTDEVIARMRDTENERPENEQPDPDAEPEQPEPDDDEDDEPEAP